MLKKSNAEIVAILTIICVVKVIIMILINILTGLSPSFRDIDKPRKEGAEDLLGVDKYTNALIQFIETKEYD